MPVPFATKEELAAGWRPLTETEFSVADTLLADASYWVRLWYPDLDPDSTDRGPGMVVRAMVKRALLNGGSEGLSQQTRNETTGPWSHSDSQTYVNPDGSLYLTKRESEMLDIITGRDRSGATSMTARGL